MDELNHRLHDQEPEQAGQAFQILRHVNRPAKQRSWVYSDRYHRVDEYS
jgi:hypothetical protein